MPFNGFICKMTSLCWCRWQNYNLSPFTSVSMCEVVGLAETFPFWAASGPFLSHLPCNVRYNWQCPPISTGLGLPLEHFPSTFTSATALISWIVLFPLFFSHARTIPTFLQDLPISPLRQYAHTHCIMTIAVGSIFQSRWLFFLQLMYVVTFF